MEQLELLGQMANETKYCSFSLTKTNRLIWKIHFVNRQHSVEDRSLIKAINKAIDYIAINRVPISPELTIYKFKDD